MAQDVTGLPALRRSRRPAHGARQRGRPVAAVLLASVLALAAGAGCATSPRPPAGEPERPEPGRAVNPADVEFMTGMIHHHAQALVMAAWAPTHGANPEVRTLAERIEVGQSDEIAAAQAWLERQGQPVPDVESIVRAGSSPPGTGHAGHVGGDTDSAHADSARVDATDHAMHMPGMLTPDELARLDAARGAEFDRLFLTFMIPHHQGAITMVEELFRAPGAAQDEAVFRFAADVQADQAAEIDRMTRMLAALPADPR